MIGRPGIDLIKSFEGFRSHAYPDPATGAEPITIGYGTTRYPNGDKVRMGEVITIEHAEALLKADAERRYKAIIGWMPDTVNQNQIDAVVSFCYNVGVGAFEKSTLRKRIWDKPNDPSIRVEFMKWIRAGGKIMAGLQRRRKAESDLYFTPMPEMVLHSSYPDNS